MRIRFFKIFECGDREFRLGERGTSSLITLGLIASLILVLALPFLSSIGGKTRDSWGCLDFQMRTEDENAPAGGELIPCDIGGGVSDTGEQQNGMDG